MNQIVWLSPEIVKEITVFFSLNLYPDAYDVIFNNTDALNYDGKKWFIAAVGVNRSEGYASIFIRTYTQIAKRIKATRQEQVPDDHAINSTSDKIAHYVLSKVKKNQGLLPTFNRLQQIDFKFASTELNLQPLQWAGTPFGVFPGCHGPVPYNWSDWSLVLRATEYAIVSSIFEGSATYINDFFDHAFRYKFLKGDRNMNSKQHFKMLYDGDCPICRAEVKWLSKWNKEGYLEFEDVSKNENSEDQRKYGKSKKELMDRIHGVNESGELISGVEVFRKSYDSVGLGWMMAPSKWPVFSSIAEWAYTIFARHRVNLGRFIDKVVALFV